MASADDIHLSPPNSPRTVHLPPRNKAAPQAMGEVPVKAGCGDDLAISAREKKRKRNKKDDEIALFKLKSAEALAGMKQVKTMISRFEQAQFSHTGNKEPIHHEVRTKSTKLSTDYELSCIDVQDECETFKSRHQDLTDVWELVLKPVRQRVVEIERVLAGSATPTRLSHEDISSLRQNQDTLKCTISKLTCSSDEPGDIVKMSKQEYRQDLHRLKKLLEEEQIRCSKLEEKLSIALRRAEIAEADKQRVVEQLEVRINSHRNNYTRMFERNRVLEEDLEKAEDHIKHMKEEFIKKLQSTQDELHKEYLKNNSLLDDLRNASVNKAQVKDIDELKEKLQTYQEMVHAEQMKNTQLEDALQDAKESVEVQMISIKEHYEQKLRNAEGFLDEEQRLNSEMMNDMAKAKQKVEDQMREMDEDFKQRLRATQKSLHEEHMKNAKLQEELNELQNVHNVNWQHIGAAIRQNAKSVQVDLNEESAKELDSQIKALELKIKEYANEVKSLKAKLYEERQKTTRLEHRVVGDIDSKHQLETLKNRLELDIEALKVNLEAEQQTASKLQKELTEEVFSRKQLQTDKDTLAQQIQTLQEALESEQQKHSELQDSFVEEINCKHQLESLKSTLEQEVDSLKAHLSREEKKGEELQRKLSEDLDLQHHLETLTAELAQERLKTAALEQAHEKACTDMGTSEEMLKKKLESLQEVISETKEKTSLLEDELDRTIETADAKTQAIETDYQQKMANFKAILNNVQKDNSKLLAEKEEMRKVEQDLEKSLKEYRDRFEEEEMKSSKLQDELISVKTLIQTSEEQSKENQQKLEDLQNALEQEQAKTAQLENKAKFETMQLEDELKSQLQVCRELLATEQLKSTILQENLCKANEEASKAQAMCKAYKQNLETMQEDYEKEKEKLAKMQTDQEHEMKSMEASLQERLKAFKEVYSEDQIKINSLTEDLKRCKDDSRASIDQLKSDNAKLKDEKAGIAADKEILEVEIEKLIARSASKTSMDWTSSSVESTSTADLSEAQDFTDEELGKNINNNRTQYQLSKTILVLKQKLAEQENSIKSFAINTHDFLAQQSQKEELCTTYIDQLENIKDMHEEEIDHLKTMVECFQTMCNENQISTDQAVQTDVVTQHKTSQTDLTTPDYVLPDVEQWQIDARHAKLENLNIDIITCLRLLAGIIERSRLEGKLSWPKLQELHASLCTEEEAGDTEMSSTCSQMAHFLLESIRDTTHDGLERNQELHFADVDDKVKQNSENGGPVCDDASEPNDEEARDEGAVNERSDAADRELSVSASCQEDLLHLKHTLDTQRNVTTEQVMQLQVQLQDAAQQWSNLAGYLVEVRAGDCDFGVQHEQAVKSLFVMFNQLLDICMSSIDRSDKLASEIYNVMNALSNMASENNGSALYEMKQYYEQQLRDADFRVRLAERQNRTHASSETSPRAAKTEAEATKQEKLEATTQQKLNDEHVQDLRGKVKQQKASLDNAAREQKQWKAKVDDLKFQLEVKNDQLEEKCRSLDLATSALADLKHDFEREQRHKQRLTMKHNFDLQERDSEIGKLNSQLQQLEDAMDKLNKTADERHKADLKVEEKKNCSNSEIKQLRFQVRKAQSKIKEVEAAKEVEVKKLTLKLDKSNGMLRALQKEHTQSLEACKANLTRLRKELDLLKKSFIGRGLNTKQVNVLSDACATIFRQLQTMLRRMQKVEELVA